MKKDNLTYLDETELVASGFKYGLTFSTLWKKGKDGREYVCEVPAMKWYYISEKGGTLPFSESRLMQHQQFKELFQ